VFRPHRQPEAEPAAEAPDDAEIPNVAAPVSELAMRATVTRADPVASDTGRSQVQVQVRYKDGRTGQFTQELANLFQPAPESPEAQQVIELRDELQLRHPEHMPKIQLPLFNGRVVPVCLDTRSPGQLVIDEPSLQRQAVHDYVHEQRHAQQTSREKRAKKNPKRGGGPPWEVPAECPNCGARVDQAVTSKDPDPRCPYCRAPLPVAAVK